MSAKPFIRIEIVSDVVCPWCYIGKKRLEKAMDATRDRFDFSTAYLPFELNAQLPSQGVGYREYLTEKFGGDEQFELLTSRVSAVARQEGITMDHARQKISPNTSRLHVLIQAAPDEKVQSRLVEGFFEAFFTHGTDLSDETNIVAVALEAGMDKASIEKSLQDPANVERIRQQEREIYALGIHSVPFYIINREVGLNGAQPAESFIKAFGKAAGAQVQRT